ncbi:MAG: tyrosine-type recombinase/integrase [candidate division WS1 bacterium]|jgi:integrase/recombinase XerC|nr:tyrosine-type recombinase/integrase [candidate division WS1 bacterium]
MKRQRATKRLPETLTSDEVEALRATCTRSATGLRKRAMLEIMLGAGLRVSEVCALMPRDIDWQTGTIRVNWGKGGRDRVVPVSDETLAHLQVWQAKRTELKMSGRQPFFGGIRNGGKRTSPRTVQAMMSTLGKQAGLDRRVHPHMLRHTYATRALDSGLTIREVQTLLGHSDVSTTMIYTHVNPEALRRKIQGDDRADQIAELQAQLAQLQAQLDALTA